MLIFRDYPGPKIERRAFKLDNNKKVVEIYKQQVQKQCYSVRVFHANPQSSRRILLSVDSEVESVESRDFEVRKAQQV
jgi:hypothetical protein